MSSLATPPEPEHTCDHGWVDRDAGVACRICRPWLAPCTACGTQANACRAGEGRCCPRCPHTPPTMSKRGGHR